MSSSTLTSFSGLGAVGAISQGAQTAATLRYQAQVQRNNADEALTAASLNANRQSIQAAKLIGAAKAGYGASGVSADSGSVMSVIAASAANAELDRQNILYGGEIRSINSMNQAHMDEIGATSAVNASYLNAATNLLTVGGQMYSQNMGGGGGASGADQSQAMAEGTNEVYGGSGDSTVMDATGGAADDYAAAAV